MRILVVGAGAVGGYFGGRLAQAGRDVTFLVRARRAEQLKQEGLQIVSPYGDVTLRPQVVEAGRISAPYDVILLSVKSYALVGAMDDCAPAVGAQTVIVPALNGMRHMDLLEERFGREPLLGGVCMVSTEIADDGRIRQLTKMQSLTYGEVDGRITPRLQKVDETLRGAGFDATVSTHILADMWQKWVRLATLGAINCLLRGDIGEVASTQGGRETAFAILRECCAIAEACGYPQSAASLEQQSAQLTSTDSRLTSSMYRDMKKGGPVEADTILGDLIGRGTKHQVTAPLLQAAFVQLSIYERSRSIAVTSTTR